MNADYFRVRKGQFMSDQKQGRRLANEREVRDRYLPISKSTLLERAREGKIPGTIRVGRRVMFDLDVLEEWMDRGGDLREAK